MPEQSTVKRYLPPVKMEVATHNSGDIYVTTLGEKYRGRWSRHKLGTVGASLSREMSLMPDIPGLQITIIPKENKVIVFDPLSEDPELLEQVSNVWRQASAGFAGKFKPLNTVEKVLDDDTFVTLLLELHDIVNAEKPCLTVISGTFPTKEQIATLPGRELNEVGSPYPHAKYKDDVDKHKILLDAMAEKGIVI